MKTVAAATLALMLLGLFLHLHTAPKPSEFEQWKSSYDIQYPKHENSYREAIFKANLLKI